MKFSHSSKHFLWPLKVMLYLFHILKKNFPKWKSCVKHNQGTVLIIITLTLIIMEKAYVLWLFFHTHINLQAIIKKYKNKNKTLNQHQHNRDEYSNLWLERRKKKFWRKFYVNFTMKTPECNKIIINGNSTVTLL